MDLMISLSLGLLAGMLAGSLPGLGITSTLILAYPILKSLDPLSILCFYIALACSVQYFGSVVGIYLGVPGETTALVSSRLGFNLMIKGQGNASLGSTAIASLIASVVAVAMLHYSVTRAEWLLPMLSVKVQTLILFSIVAILIFYRSNTVAINVCFISLGMMLSTVGYNPAGISLTFNTDMLVPGLNPAVVLMMIFVIPNLLRFWDQDIHPASRQIDLDPRKSLGWIAKRRNSILRGSVIGSFFGLIPGIGPVISSNVAAQIEQRFTKSPSAGLLSAEAANNASIITCFIPFFALGLTLMAHEAVINDLLVNRNTLISTSWFSDAFYGSWSRLDLIAVALLIANAIAFLISWPASRSLILIYKIISYKKLVMIIIGLVSCIILYQSHKDLRLDLDMMTVIVALPLTYLLIKKRLDTLPLMFSYLLGDSLIKSFLFLKNIT